MDVRELNALETSDAAAGLAACCTSTVWIDRMLAGRPFRDTTALLTKAEEVWWDLSAEDWQEAFAAHPTGAPEASAEVRLDLEAATGEYTDTFGYAFIVFAADPVETLEACRRRLGNDPLTELGVTAAEMTRIINLRLRRLLDIS